MRNLVCLCVAAAHLWGQSGTVSRQSDLAARIREKVIDTLVHQPNYTCLETVERSQATPAGEILLEDTLRIEVGLIRNKEMFAWPGSKEFDDNDLNLVGSGMFGNGNFAVYTRMLFFGGGLAFMNQRADTIGGRNTVRFDFQVPQASSDFHLQTQGREDVAGFHGSFHVDAETLDLKRLEIIADDIPSELGLTEASDRVEYGRVQFGDENFLLPVESFSHLASATFSHRNYVRFSACRKFTGESTLIFIDPDVPGGGPAEVAVKEVELPVNAELRLLFTADFDPAKGAVGDSVEARLKVDLKRGKELIAPKGAIARGRILRLDRYPSQYALRVRFTDLEWAGGHAPLKAVLDRVASDSITRDPQSGDIVIPRKGTPRLNSVPMIWKTVR